MNSKKQKISKPQSIVLFDGVCNLCESSVQFILLRDKKAHFKFASLQSAFAQKILSENGVSAFGLESVVLVENNQIFQRSDAALRIVRKLDGGWKLLYFFIIVPRFIRDNVYNFVAKNRYRWFGKKEECLIPKLEWKERFL